MLHLDCGFLRKFDVLESIIRKLEKYKVSLHEYLQYTSLEKMPKHRKRRIIDQPTR